VIRFFSSSAARCAAAPRRLDLTLTASLAFSLLAALFFVAMLVSFAAQSWPVWRHDGSGYLAGTAWFYRAQIFGVAPMVYGTLVVSMVALFFAAPVAFGSAVFIAEFLPARLRLAFKLPVELLAGVPSVVYGLLGILFLRPWVYSLLEPWEPLSGDTLLTGGLLLGVMILPTVTTLAEDALRGVSASERLAARGLGLSSTETLLRVSLPRARAGMAAALLLGLGRALGETIAVYLVIGRQDNQWPERWLSPAPLARAGQTLTTKLGGSETHLAWGEPLHWGAMMGLALVLLVLVTALTLVGSHLVRVRGGHA
jgi:phosphate transport system permease protein